MVSVLEVAFGVAELRGEEVVELAALDEAVAEATLFSRQKTVFLH